MKTILTPDMILKESLKIFSDRLLSSNDCIVKHNDGSVKPDKQMGINYVYRPHDLLMSLSEFNQEFIDEKINALADAVIDKAKQCKGNEDSKIGIIFSELPIPQDFDFASARTCEGISMRFVRAYDVLNDDWISRIDVLFGVTEIKHGEQ